MKKFYITTAIDYVNSSPHLGHAYEKIAADVIARWHRLKGEDVFFLTGTDENAQKNEQAAKEKKVPVKEFVDKNTKKFIQLCNQLNISNNDFIRTTNPKHIKFSQDLFSKTLKKGDIYKGNYEGWYCQGCEAFLTEKELTNGECPEHKKKPTWIKEENYFFKMSKYEKQIIKLLESKTFVLPEGKRKEMLNRVKNEGLKDLCVSRKGLNWGIKIPEDKDYTVYVWYDALLNYISALDSPKLKKYWPADLHLIGKGINWFHTVIWPSILLSADIELPKTVFVHGYINLAGEKLSKSQGKVIDPVKLTKDYGIDPVRYYLIREIPFGQDGDFSEESLKDRLNNELANDLGNLLSRTLSMVEKYFQGKVPKTKTSKELSSKLKLNKITKYLDNYELHLAISEIWKFINECNKYINEKKPWESDNKEETLYSLLDSLKIVSILISPFIPETSDKINKQLNIKKGSLKDCKFNLLKSTKINKKEILFKKIE